MFETKIGRAKDGSWAYAVHEFLTGRWMCNGRTTHRVTGSDGVVHCLPAPGNNGCVLRWKGRVVA